MVMKIDGDNWLGADGIYYPTADTAHMSIQKAREAAELSMKLKELESFPALYGYDPRTNDRPTRKQRNKSSKSTVEHYDVALSFAGENRVYVHEVAEFLKTAAIKVFYDDFFKVDLWGKDLYTYLSEVYRNRSTYTVIFASEFYAKKAWTNHERQSAQSRAVESVREYILPARFDDTEIPGILSSTGYIDLRSMKPEECAKLIIEKVRAHGDSKRE